MFLLSSRGVLKFSGSNIEDFLNRLFTCNLIKLKQEEFTFGALLNNKGRFLFDFFLYKEKDCILIDIEKTSIQDFKNKILFYDLLGEAKCEELLNVKVLATKHFLQNWRNVKFEGRFISFFEESESYKTEEEYNLERIKNCLPNGETDLIKEKSIILEYNYEQAGAIDFNKGCYVGQEFVTMAKRLGDIKKTLACLEVEGVLKLQLCLKEDVKKGLVEIDGKSCKVINSWL